MNNFLQKMKRYVIIFVSGLVTGILVFFSIKSAQDGEDAVQSGILDHEAGKVEGEIEDIKEDLDGITADDLTDKQVEDFWSDL